ncbi:hypothetical protein ACEQPO_18045 [Bacillus sp. SL00103]
MKPTRRTASAKKNMRVIAVSLGQVHRKDRNAQVVKNAETMHLVNTPTHPLYKRGQ